MSEGDIFREVEADLRREQLSRYWQKYGVYAIGVAVAVVLFVGGYQAWTWRQASLAASDGAAFVEASLLQEGGDLEGSAEKFSELAHGGSGQYSALASLRLAAVSAARGDDAGAVAAYDEVAGQTDDPMLRGFARIQAATLLVDSAPLAEMESRLSDMRAASNPWRHSARELLALSAYNAGVKDKARELYEELLRDTETPLPMRQRAEMMLAVIDSPVRTGQSAAGE